MDNFFVKTRRTGSFTDEENVDWLEPRSYHFLIQMSPFSNLHLDLNTLRKPCCRKPCRTCSNMWAYKIGNKPLTDEVGLRTQNFRARGRRPESSRQIVPVQTHAGLQPQTICFLMIRHLEYLNTGDVSELASGLYLHSFRAFRVVHTFFMVEPQVLKVS